MSIFQTIIELRQSFSILATAIVLIVAPAAASAQETVRDHRTPAKVNDHRKQVRDHRAPRTPANGGGVTVSETPSSPTTTSQ